MIDPGTPTTRGTDWLSLDVPQIWATLADHETETHHRVVSGWRKAAELSELHLQRLQAYRRELAAAWPPTGSAAAQEYLDRLGYLIETIQQAHDTASANYTTFSGATSAITQRRKELQQVYDDYTAKVQIRLDYDRLMQERKAMGGGDIFNSAPPVSDQELQQLRGRARLVMYELSDELRQAEVELKMPPRYQERVGRKPGDNASEYDDDSSSQPEPARGVAPAAIAALPSVIGSAASPSSTGTTGAGPVLGSAGPLAPTPSLTPGTPPGVASPTTPGGGTGLPPGLAPGVGTPVTPPALHPDRGGSVTGGPGTGRMSGGPSGNRVIAPGGIIGGGPTPGPSSTPARASRINPVGGVIGGAGAGIAPTGRGSALGPRPASQSVAGHPTAGGQGRRREQDDPKRWNPDHPWETEQGVEPVLLPPRPPGRIDPGPAIGHLR